MTILPSAYTVREGGLWFPWLPCYKPIEMIEFQRKAVWNLEINYVLLHSLSFTKDLAGFDGRWDCINGWTN